MAGKAKPKRNAKQSATAAKPARMNKSDLLDSPTRMPTGTQEAPSPKSIPKFKPGKAL